MSKKYGRQQFKTCAKPSSNPESGFTEIFADSGNAGALTSLYPNGDTLILGAMAGTHQAVFVGYTTVAAGATITIPGTHAAVTITDDSTTAANAVTLPTPVAGQLLYIYNADPAGTTGDIAIPAGKTAMLIALGGAWHLIGFATTL